MIPSYLQTVNVANTLGQRYFFIKAFTVSAILLIVAVYFLRTIIPSIGLLTFSALRYFKGTNFVAETKTTKNFLFVFEYVDS